MILSVHVFLFIFALVNAIHENPLELLTYEPLENSAHPWKDHRVPFTKDVPLEALQQVGHGRENYEEIYRSVGVETFENDIIVSPNFPRPSNGTQLEEKNFLLDSALYWPTRVIPVVIDPHAPYSRAQRALIQDGLRQYHLHTCVRFVPRTTEDDYIFVTHDPNRGCSSNVGRQGGRQVMYLKIPGCVTLIGTSIHEILHNLGFFHEHSRPDRDQFVKVVWDSILPGLEGNFRSYSPTTVTTLGLPYDYDSVMEYSAVAFSRDKSYTIYPYYAPPERLGQRLKFSDIDIKKINTVFHCSELEMDTGWNDDPIKKVLKAPTILLGLPGICYNRDPVDAAIFDDGNLYLFKKGYFWIFKPLTVERYAAKNTRPMSVNLTISSFLPRNIDTIVALDNRFYFFSNRTVFSLTTLNKSAVVDMADTEVFFLPIVWSVKGVFKLANQLYFSDGSTLYLYDPTKDVVLKTIVLHEDSGLPQRHDLIISTPDGRIMIFAGLDVYLTKPDLFVVERGFPLRFHSMFC